MVDSVKFADLNCTQCWLIKRTNVKFVIYLFVCLNIKKVAKNMNKLHSLIWRKFTLIINWIKINWDENLIDVRKFF